MNFCKSDVKKGRYCPLAEICCRCAKTVGKTKSIVLNDELFAYDETTMQCPNFMDKSKYLFVKSFER